MDTRKERAGEMFVGGFNCAQSVLASFCDKYGLDTDTALKMACGLGGGCRAGEICGALTGGALVIGLKYGQCQSDDNGAKLNCYAKMEQFTEEFRALSSSVICRDILGYDISSEEGKIKAREMDRRLSPCAAIVKNTVGVLEELGY